jgi:hypothetical protein
MSKAKCLERGFEVNSGPGPSGQCGYVSFSNSPGPRSRSDFCQCHPQSSCGDSLEAPPGERWQTFLVEEPKRSALPLVILACVAVAAALFLVCLMLYWCRRKIQKAQRIEQSLAATRSATTTTCHSNNVNSPESTPV